MTEENAITEHAGGDELGSRFGMWLFLATEVFLFLPPFALFSAYRLRYPGDFHAASVELSVVLGGVNTAVLLTSSLAVTLAVSLLKRGKSKPALAFTTLTALLGVVFLLVKSFEWYEKVSHGVYPGSGALSGAPPGEVVFTGLYFFMTGVHALHVLAGVVLLGVMAVFIVRGTIGVENTVRLANSSLYWHIVDVIWTFLFPVLYLIN